MKFALTYASLFAGAFAVKIQWVGQQQDEFYVEINETTCDDLDPADCEPSNTIDIISSGCDRTVYSLDADGLPGLDYSENDDGSVSVTHYLEFNGVQHPMTMFYIPKVIQVINGKLMCDQAYPQM